MSPKIGIQAIVPKQTFTSKSFKEALIRALDKTSNQLVAEFKKTTRTWLTVVEFYATKRVEASGMLYISIGTNSNIYRYVAEGTKPHVIRPKKSRALAYSSGYRPKTRVGRISGNAGGAFGDTVFSKEVQHPGTQGRRFAQLIASKHRNLLQKNVNDELRKINR